MSAVYDVQGYLPAGLAPTMPVWSMPDELNRSDVNKEWYLGVPVGRWNMTSFNYNQFANKNGDPVLTRYCALNNQDFDIEPGEVWFNGQHGDLFPNCYTRNSDADGRNRKFFEQAQMAQALHANGKFEAVSEINRTDPWGLQPCAGTRTIFEVLLPVAAAVIAGVVTGELLGFIVPSDAPQAIKSILTLGATAFGWEFGTAISEGDEVTRMQIFQTSSVIVGVSIGATLPLFGVYLATDDWQSHEMMWVVGGGAAGYYFLSPLVLPYIDNFSTGIIGVLWRFLNGIVGLITGVVCNLSNWDVDGCSVSRNSYARSWDRTLLSAAAVDELANNYDLDPKQQEVAYQALLLNAASFDTWETPYSVANQVNTLDNERSWNGTVAPDDRINAYSAFGPVVQATLNKDPAWYEKLSGGTYYPYYLTMFEKDSERSLLQKCATAQELLDKPKMQTWMSDAHKLAEQGKLQPYPVSIPKETFSCEVAYLRCMQQPNEGSAYELARVFTSNYAEVFANCRKDPAKLKYVVWWEVFLQWRDPATGAQRVIAENYVLTEGQDPLNLLNEQELIAGVVAIFRHFKLDTTIGDNTQAQEIWRFWLYCAQKNRSAPIPLQPTSCQEDIYHIARDNPTYAELGRRAAATGTQPIHGCSDKEQGEIYAWRGMNTTNCDTLVQNGVRAFNQNPSKAGECGWGSAFMQASDFRTQCSLESQNQVEQWVAACSQ